MASEESKPWNDDDLDLRQIIGMDSNANWLLGIKRDEFLKGDAKTLVPCMFVMEPDADLRHFHATIKDAIEIAHNMDGVQLVEFELGRDGSKSVGRIWPLLANWRFFKELCDNPDLSGLRDYRAKQVILSSPSSLFSHAEGILRLPDLNISELPDENSVIIGCIDDGIAYAHERFRSNQHGSRVFGAWDQHDRWSVGIFHDKNSIDAAIAGASDEEQIYRVTGLIDYRDMNHKTAAWRRAHGTHVLDLASGYPPGNDRNDRPLFAVNLPADVIEDTSGSLLDIYLFLSSAYIVIAARALFDAGIKPRPIVINASVGYLAGAHDGQSFVDDIFSEIDLWMRDGAPEEEAGVKFVLPAGNEHQSRCHANFSVSDGPVEFDWMVLPNDHTDSYFEVWLPDDGGNERLRLTVTSPDGTAKTISDVVNPWANSDGFAVWKDTSGRDIAFAETIWSVSGRAMLKVRVKPTDSFQPSVDAVAPSGRWHLRFEQANNEMDGEINVWVQRDDSVYGYPRRGRQSYFLHEDYIRYDRQGIEVRDDETLAQSTCPVTRQSLLNAVATGPSVYVSGGYVARTCKIARYSAGGPNVPPEDPALRKPDVLMTSEDSLTLPGVLAAGSRSGSVVWMSGTSVAAPQLARRIADMIASGAPVTRETIKAGALADNVCPGENPMDAVNVKRGGWGRLPRPDQMRVTR